MANICTECGEQVDPEAKFCPVCLASIVPSAAPLKAVTPTPPQAAAPSPLYQAPPATPAQAGIYPPPAKSNLPWIIAAIVGVLVLAGIGFVVMKPSTSTPVEVTDPPVAGGGSTTATDTTAAIGPEVVKYVISDANIRNMATAKGEESKVVGQIQRGVQIKGAMYPALGGSGYWFKLSDGRGFVSAVNLSDAPPAAVIPAAAPAAGPAPAAPVVAGGTRAPVAGAPFCQVATKGGNLRIRSSPNGPIIGGMPKGARFQAFNSESDPAGAEWYQVQPFETRYPNGWVSADFIAC